MWDEKKPNESNSINFKRKKFKEILILYKKGAKNLQKVFTNSAISNQNLLFFA